MAVFRRRKRNDPPKIAEALKPYHYPEDREGHPRPTPGTRHGSGEVPEPGDTGGLRR